MKGKLSKWHTVLDVSLSWKSPTTYRVLNIKERLGKGYWNGADELPMVRAVAKEGFDW